MTAIAGYAGAVQREACEHCDIIVESVCGQYRCGVEATVVTTPTGELTAPDWTKLGKDWPHLKEVEFVAPLGNGKVDMILGTDATFFHQSWGEVRGEGATDPIARHGPPM